jgi:hypothetical protein
MDRQVHRSGGGKWEDSILIKLCILSKIQEALAESEEYADGRKLQNNHYIFHSKF